MLEAVASAAAAPQAQAMGKGSAACKTAERNLDDQEGLSRIYDRLVLAVAIATAAALITTIVILFIGGPGEAIAGGVGTIVTGVAMGFVLKQRQDARDREDALRDLRDKYCDVPT